MTKFIINNWDGLLIVIVVIIIVGFILLTWIDINTAKPIVKNIIKALPLPISNNVKDELANILINIISNMRKYTNGTIRGFVRESVKYIPVSIVREATDGLPDDIVNETKCKRIIKDNRFVDAEKIYSPEELPWDEKINYCYENGYDVEDVDLDEFIFTSTHKKSRIFLY